jgi:hypothetical protein
VNLPAGGDCSPSAATALQRSATAADTEDVRPRALAIALLVLLAACGGGDGDRAAEPARDAQVGTADVERLLVGTQRRKSPRLRVGTARCPDQVRLANGTRFICTVLIEGVQAPYRVTLHDVDPARATGRFALEPAKPIIEVARVVGLIRGRLQPTARAATVRCGAAKVRVVEVGASIGCTITLGDAVQKVSAVVKDLQGTVVVRS